MPWNDVTGATSSGPQTPKSASNDSALQPFTINSQLLVIARLRTYNFDNQMPATTITQYVSYDAR